MPFGMYGNSSCGMGYLADPFSCGNVRCRRFSVLNSKCELAVDELFRPTVQATDEKLIVEQSRDGDTCQN